MVAINYTSGENTFKINGKTFVRNFHGFVSNDYIRIVNAYDTRCQILSYTLFSDVKVNGNTFGSAELLLQELAPILFLKSGTGGEILPSGNNVKVTPKVLIIDWNAAGKRDEKVIAKINALPTFSVSGNELVIFKIYKNQTMYQSGNYNPEIHRWKFTQGKGTYGQGGITLTGTNAIEYEGYTRDDYENIEHDLGEIGNIPINTFINDNSVTYTTNQDTWNVFKAKRNGVDFDYLYIGNSYLIGNYQNEPEAEETFYNDFLELGGQQPTPPDLSDFTTYEDLDKTLYDKAKYYLTDVIANASITGSEDFAIIETDTHFYFASKTTNEESFEGSSIKPANLEGQRFELTAPDSNQNGYNFWQLSTSSAVNYLQNNGFVWFQLWEKGGSDVEIIDNLTSTASGKALSANQGRVLKGFIDVINTLLNSDDTTLDELQEIVDYIKQNKQDLQNLSIPNIAGLVDALAGKTATGGFAGTAQELKNLIDAIQTFSGNYADLTGKPKPQYLTLNAQNEIDLSNTEVNFYNWASPTSEISFTTVNLKKGGKAIIRLNANTSGQYDTVIVDGTINDRICSNTNFVDGATMELYVHCYDGNNIEWWYYPKQR